MEPINFMSRHLVVRRFSRPATRIESLLIPLLVGVCRLMPDGTAPSSTDKMALARCILTTLPSPLRGLVSAACLFHHRIRRPQWRQVDLLPDENVYTFQIRLGKEAELSGSSSERYPDALFGARHSLSSSSGPHNYAIEIHPRGNKHVGLSLAIELSTWNTIVSQ